jgi:SAM-dependent methyltransferase
MGVATDPSRPLPTPSDGRVERLVDELGAEIVLRHATGNRVLDLGHGAPRVTDWVAARAQTHTIVDAVDLGRGGTIRLPLRDATFDLVYTLRTLPHLGHDAETSEQAARSLLSEIARLLAPGGVALVQIDNPMSVYGAYHGIRRLAKALESGPLVIDSARGLTRFDTLSRALSMVPPSLAMTELYGLRVTAVAPHLLAMPLVGRILTGLDWWCRDRTLIRRLGAHLLLELRRLSRTQVDP